MKAVIVECSNGAAVALCDDGTFRKLKNKGYSIGQELLIRQKQSSNRMVQKLSICASLALVLLSFAGIGSHSYVEPYSYVSLDINPSIEYALNRYDKVISVSGVNTEGQQIVSSIESDIKNQNITTALGVTIGQLEKDHYISQKAYNHVIVSVYSANDTKAQSIDAIPVSKEVKDDADSLGITPGKLALIHAVAETTSDSDFDVSKWTDKTVSELESTIQQASSQNPDSGLEPAAANVVNSEYLSSVLDDNTANKPDNSTAAAMDAVQGAGSASADKQQTITDDTSAGSGSGNSVSAAKPDQSGNTITSASDGSTGSSVKPAGSGSSTADKNTANQDSNTSDKNASSDKGESSGTSPSKDPASDHTGSPSKDPASSDSDSKTDEDLTEDSSGKKDPYPLPDTSTEDSATDDKTTTDETSSNDIMQEDTSGKNSAYTDSSDKNAIDSNVTDPGALDKDTVRPDSPDKNDQSSSDQTSLH